MTELEKRVAQLEQEVAALRLEINEMPNKIGSLILEATKRGQERLVRSDASQNKSGGWCEFGHEAKG